MAIRYFLARLADLVRLRRPAFAAGTTVSARIQWRGRGARILLSNGESIFLRHRYRDIERPPTDDFAAFALAAIAQSDGVAFRLDGAVSQSAIDSLHRLESVYRDWGMLAPGRHWIEAERVVAGPSPLPGKLMCLSGGMDSTYAAFSDERREGAAALLVAGADYRKLYGPGFREVEQRVGRIAQELGLSMEVVETDIRKFRMNWRMVHPMVLAACAHLLSRQYGHLNIAADFSLEQERTLGPWGNHSLVVPNLSGDAMKVRQRGEQVARVEKYRQVVAAAPALVPIITVCFKDKSHGGNCGRCYKCLIHRIAIGIAGGDVSGVFEHMPDPAAALSSLPIPADPVVAAPSRLFDEDLLRNLPADSPLIAVLHKRKEAREKAGASSRPSAQRGSA